MKNLFCLLVFVSLVSCKSSYVAGIKEWGIYSQTSTFSNDRIHDVGDFNLETQAKKIYIGDLTSEQSFGIQFFIESHKKMIPAEWRISGPFSNTASAQISRRYFQEIKSFQDYFIGYHFLNELERVPGDWTIELFVKSDKIFSFEFELLPGKCPQQNDCYSEPVNNPDVFPTYVGGDAAMTKFIAENVVYPLEARKRKLEDKVYVKIIINKDGTIGDSEVVIGKYDILNQAALEVFDKMPAWIPGELNGEPVRVPIIIPINFRVI